MDWNLLLDYLRRRRAAVPTFRMASRAAHVLVFFCILIDADPPRNDRYVDAPPKNNAPPKNEEPPKNSFGNTHTLDYI